MVNIKIRDNAKKLEPVSELNIHLLSSKLNLSFSQKKMLAATTKYSSAINATNHNASSVASKSSVTTSKPKGKERSFFYY